MVGKLEVSKAWAINISHQGITDLDIVVSSLAKGEPSGYTIIDKAQNLLSENCDLTLHVHPIPLAVQGLTFSVGNLALPITL
jgi:hypothetical protein